MKPAARITDLHVCPMVTGLVPHVGGPIIPPGDPKVLIAGLPAARVSDKAVCCGPPDMIVVGAPTTFIGGLPAARLGDQTAHGGIIVAGCPTVLIGTSGGGGGGGAGGGGGRAIAPSAGTLQGMTMRAAKRDAKPFCEECARAQARRRSGQQAETSGHSEAQAAQRAALTSGRRRAAAFCKECSKS